MELMKVLTGNGARDRKDRHQENKGGKEIYTDCKADIVNRCYLLRDLHRL